MIVNHRTASMITKHVEQWTLCREESIRWIRILDSLRITYGGEASKGKAFLFNTNYLHSFLLVLNSSTKFTHHTDLPDYLLHLLSLEEKVPSASRKAFLRFISNN